MSSMRRLIPFAVLIAVAVAAACNDNKTTPLIAKPSAADSADQVLIGVHFFLTSKGIQRGELFADTGYVFDDQTRLDLRHVRVSFMKDNGAPNGTMRSDRATYSTRTEILEGWGNVVVNLVDGRAMKTPHVVYKRSANDISSDTTFEISGPKGEYRGIGVSFDPGFTRFSCQRNCGGSSAVVLPNR